MKLYLTIICFLTFIFSSCSTDTEINTRLPRHFEDQVKLDDYELSHRQNSTYLRLVDYIQFDDFEKKYILDIPEAWKDSICFTDSEYSDAQKIIDDLNSLKKNR